MGPRIFILIVFIALVFGGIYYISQLGKGPAAPCPAGSRYERAIAGGGWADTDLTDTWGRCIPESEINAAENQ